MVSPTASRSQPTGRHDAVEGRRDRELLDLSLHLSNGGALPFRQELALPHVEGRGLDLQAGGFPRVLKLQLHDTQVVLGLLVVDLVQQAFVEGALRALEQPASRLKADLEQRDVLGILEALLPRLDGLGPR